METDKNAYINKLIKEAQESIWKNEMAMEYTERYANADDKEKTLKIKSCQHAIEKDKEYIGFLKEKLQ